MTDAIVIPPVAQPDPRHVAKPRVWHLFVLLLLAQAAILFMTAVGIGFVAAVRRHAGPPPDPHQQAALFKELAASPEVMLFSVISSVVVCAGLALLVGALSPQPFVKRMRLGSGRLSIAELAVGSIGFLGLSNASDAILRLLPGYAHSGPALFNRLLQDRAGAGLWLTVALVGVAAPLGEEMFYRGALQTRFAERFGRRAGLTVTSVAFGLAHFEPIHMLFALAAGFYLGWLSDLADSCRASLVVHAVYNTLAAVGATWLASTEGVLTTAPVAAASGLLAAASTFWLWSRAADRVAHD